ncbi:6-phospho-beta-glucosidase [Enterococcus avium]|uniref:6-phospho-beta-glucosidase n=1 Tax=Enterococcus TaxID=1350 RepID=UPI001A957CFB|nr:6-phospho-beta-glucosidase [Enterococcus avium]MBO1139876.1 6-phospho-beta-glucosidase [Enterococcus avium]
MNKKVKIVTIGGGSSYTPELMEGFIKRYEEMPIKEICLVDIPEGIEKLKIVSEMSQRMWDASPYDVTVTTSLDRKSALKDADFVTTQFRVGMLEARIKDERIPLSYGVLGQETNGPGGIFKALRTIPVILDIVNDMKEVCPNAWLINFTNPSGMVTEAIVRYGKWEKVIGLCNVPVNAMMKEPALLNKERHELIYEFAGLNHFHWHRVFDTDGNNLTRELIHSMFKEDDGTPKNIHKVPFFKEQLLQMNAIPCGYHRYYYREEEMLKHSILEYETIGTRAEQVKRIEKELFDLYKNPDLDHKPKQLSERGGAYYSDAACEAIVSIYSNKNSYMVVSTKNRGAIPDLPEDCIVEVSSLIGGKGARTLAFGELGTTEKGWLQLMKNMELSICEVAVTGDYGLLLNTIILNPLIPGGETAKKIMDELLIAHQNYLPQFSESIARLNNVTIKDPVVQKLLDENK